MKQLRIGFLTSHDPMSRRAWSSTIYSNYTAVKKHWGSVTSLGPVSPSYETLGKTCNTFSRALFHKKYNYQHSIVESLHYGRIFHKKLTQEQFDCIVAPAASTEIACLKTTVPIIYVIDATFSLLAGYYSCFSGLLSISIREGNWIERAALKKASIVLCASQWARQSAIHSYSIDEAKVGVVPFGANIETVPTSEAIQTKKKSNRCRLLFLGVDWERKGGSIAFNTLRYLHEMGVPAELTVCGCIPPVEFVHKAMNIIPFLDKTSSIDLKKLYDLLFSTDFLLLPTRAEGFGIVFCEANAFGVPAITSDTGGISEVIIDGENGFKLPLSATGADYARLIWEIYSNDHRYYKLLQTSREAFEKKLNWDVWAKSARDFIKARLYI